MNLPNKITLTRIFMIPVFVAVFYCGLLSKWCFLASAIIFLLAAATDALDGHIARSRNLVTNFGKFLDPIADKVLVSTALIVLLTFYPAMLITGFEGGMYVAIGISICIALILARELIVSGFRIIAAERKLVLAADKLGKVKTVTQDLAVFVLLLALAFSNSGAMEIMTYIGCGLLAVSTILTVVSGINYLVKNKAVLKDEAPAQNETEEN